MGDRLHLRGRPGKLHGAGQNGCRLINAGILLGIVLTGTGRFLGIGVLSFLHILIAAVVFAYCEGMQRLTVKGRVVCGFLTAVFLGVVAAALGGEFGSLFFRSWVRWLAGQEGWKAEWSAGYEILQVVMAAFVSYGLQFILQRFLIVKVLTAELLISGLLFGLLTEWEISHTAVAFALCYILLVYAEWVQREWHKVKGTDRQRSVLWLMPFAGLYFILLLCMPAPQEPYEWRFVKETCSEIGESLIGFAQNFMQGGGDDFDTGLSGFSENGALQDGLQENDREMLTVQGTGNLVTNVYLTGKIYDTFDGYGWQQKYQGPESGRTGKDIPEFWDAVQTREAARLYEASSLQDQLTAATLKIRYKYFRTSCLVAPLKTKDIRMARERDFYVWDGDNLSFREKRGYGTMYEISYYQINAGADSFDRFLRAALANVRVSDATKDRTAADDTGAAGRRRQIYQVYVEDVELSEETRRYVKELTAGAQDPLERLRRMEAGLASFTYTKQPRKLPEKIEDAETFLEYFLLEGREGYCTHFATAFVLLARAQGMPARYVEGFCVPLQGKHETSVYGDMAHAWPEVYFDGVGWIPFEPTPGYVGLRYTPWAVEESRRIPVSYGEAAHKPAGAAQAVPVGESLDAEEEAAGTGGEVWRFLGVLGYAVLAVCVTGSGILALQQVMRRRRYRRLDMTGKFRMEIAVNLRALGLLGLRRGEGETLQEFRERAESLCALQCINDYEEILYGEKAAGQEMLETAVRERKELLAVLRERKKWRYVLFLCRLTV